MSPKKFRLSKDGKIVGYERFVYCNQREGYVKGKSLVPQHSKDGIDWGYIYVWDLKTRPKGYWFEARLDMDVYIEHDDKEQFTGKHDKNGTEIYGGDRVKGEHITTISTTSGLDTLSEIDVQQKWEGIVEWQQNSCSFVIRENQIRTTKLLAIHQFEVIGNIHEGETK